MPDRTARTIIMHAPGGPEDLTFEDRPLVDPGPGEVLIAHHACGLNFIDFDQRSGLYPMALPER